MTRSFPEDLLNNSGKKLAMGEWAAYKAGLLAQQ
jgi:hypothetical protein